MTSININFIITNVRPPEYLIYLISLLLLLSLSLAQLQLVLTVSECLRWSQWSQSLTECYDRWSVTVLVSPLYIQAVEHEDTQHLYFPQQESDFSSLKEPKWVPTLFPCSPPLQHFSKWRIWYLIVVRLTGPRGLRPAQVRVRFILTISFREVSDGWWWVGTW